MLARSCVMGIEASLSSRLSGSFLFELLLKVKGASGVPFFLIKHAIAVFLELRDELLALVFQILHVSFALGWLQLEC